MQIARVPSWSGPECIPWPLKVFFTQHTFQYTILVCLLADERSLFSLYCYHFNQRYQHALFSFRGLFIFHNAPAWDVTCIIIRYNAFLSLFWIQPSWSRFVDLKSKTAWQLQWHTCCGIFWPYTYIYDIQFHILTYTDMQVMKASSSVQCQINRNQTRVSPDFSHILINHSSTFDQNNILLHQRH